nr:hypothetical protein CFP56_49110 [Quercus suber]
MGYQWQFRNSPAQMGPIASVPSHPCTAPTGLFAFTIPTTQQSSSSSSHHFPFSLFPSPKPTAQAQPFDITVNPSEAQGLAPPINTRPSSDKAPFTDSIFR